MSQLSARSFLGRIACVAISLYLCSMALCGAAELTTAQVKARYIQNFTKYFSWPDVPADGPYRIGLMDDSAIKTALEDVIRGKNLQGKVFEILSLEQNGSFSNLCVLYVSETNRDRLDDILATVPKGTLTVGEGNSFLARGGMIEFKMTEGKVRFRVNLKRIREDGLTVDSKLLSVAEEVLEK